MSIQHVIVLDIVGLSTKHLEDGDCIPNISRLLKSGVYAKLIPDFPPVTCTVQASMLSGTRPNRHGVICNGYHDRKTRDTIFWGQPYTLVQTHRIWDIVKAHNPDFVTAVICLQQILGANSDVVITPKPKHLDTGETISWCYTQPRGYYEELVKAYGDFPLMNYWGPMASINSSRWISQAAIHTLRQFQPNLMLVYLPHLDYSSQRYGPGSKQNIAELKEVDNLVGNILDAVENMKFRDQTAILLVSEYGFTDANGAVLPNVIFRNSKLLNVKLIDGQEYIDFEKTKAFAMVDHQITHIFVKSDFIRQAQELLEKTEGVEEVLNEEGKRQWHINHPLSGELIAIAKTNRWFAYYWWNDPCFAPDFAHTVDIHRKPGYDPVELFFDPETKTIPLKPELIKGAHGYPPKEDAQKAAFVLSYEGLDISFPTEVHCTQVAPTIATLLNINAHFDAESSL